VEEVQDISCSLGTCFNYILRKANVLAKGVLHSSLIFDVWIPLCFFSFLHL
jgi:hypothetical protein